MIVDTCYVIDLMRGDEGALRHLEATRTGVNFVPVIAVHELHRGLTRSRLPGHEYAKIRAAMENLTVHPFDEDAARIAGQLEGALKNAGTPIDVEDCMVAGIALRHGVAVVTRNTDFGKVQGLDVVTY